MKSLKAILTIITVLIVVTTNFTLQAASPNVGTYYLHSFPVPFPCDPYDGVLPIITLDAARHIYEVEDTPEDYAALQDSNVSSMRAMSAPMPNDGIGGDYDNPGGTPLIPRIVYGPDDLWLEITGVQVINNLSLSYLVIHPPSTNLDGVYDLFATTNLNSESSGLNATNWVWVLRNQPGQTNLIVTNLAWATQCYFRLATTNDSDSDGLSDAFEKLVSHSNPNLWDTDGDNMPDGWEWNNFGTFSQTPNDDFDENGTTDWYEYTYSQYVPTRSPANPVAFAWGLTNNGQCNVPTPLNDAIAFAAGENHSLILRETGDVLAFGANDYGQVKIPLGVEHIIAIAAGDDHSLALKNDGTVLAWGRNDFGQISVPANLTNVIAISAGGQQSLALKNDGTVIQWGQTFASPPSDLTNAVAIASGMDFHVALRANGNVVAWGNDTYGQINVPPNLTNVVAVAAGGEHALALLQNGTVVSWGSNSYGETNVPVNLTNALAVAAGYNHSVVLRNDGTVVAWGDNSCGQTNVPNFLRSVKLIGAGGYHSLAGYFMRQTQFPINVSQDLLLIYNTNSVNSTAIKDYYLAHRPMVQGANVLGIGCTTNEIFLPAEYTNVFAAQVQAWLAQNPTKRPQYVILFPDIPSRVDSGGTAYASVQHQLGSWCAPGWFPTVTSINLGTMNDCMAYIDKLEFFGTNYSPGSLIISASAGNYGNQNYYFDVDSSYGSDFYGFGSNGQNALLQKGVPSTSIFVDSSSHVTLATNVTGYLTWGVYTGLGANYSIDGSVVFTGSSDWFLIETVESFNGQRYQTGQGNFIRWFASNAFGGANYSSTPVGAVCNVEEPQVSGVNDSALYYGSWAAGKNFGICAWYSKKMPYFMAVGDPFVKK